MNTTAMELFKGLGKFPHGSWNIGNEDVNLPTAVLNLENLKHNINWMRGFTEAYGVELCPHVKTTMCPKIIEMQMAAGAWGVTTATVHQTSVLHSLGLTKRILMANQLVGKRNMEIVSEILESDPNAEIFVLVDSVKNVEQLCKFFSARSQKLNVLIEIGILDVGRTGVRNELEFANVLEAVNKTNGCLCLRGLEFYEGLLSGVEEVRGLCQKVAQAARGMLSYFNNLTDKKRLIISGAGSAKFDIVAEELR